jgi:hypothetical protein
MNTKSQIPERTVHASLALARAAARKLGSTRCQIVESKAKGQLDTGPWVFYLEIGGALNNSMIRFWENCHYSGPGRKA